MQESLTPKNNIQENKKNKVWNSARAAECNRLIEDGLDTPGGTPFYEGEPTWKAADIVYDYTPEEMKEIAKCATDVVYFANKYAHAMTDYGIQKITLRKYQEDVLRSFQDHRFNVFLASRQIGKTVSSAIFITWYILFNIDKNVMILANKGATAAEIIDKVKAVIQGLPFFLKPGIVKKNQGEIKVDNGCRIMGSATTGTAAIGFALHLVYMDEFAHVPANIVESFYRSVYPTLSASKISRIIITSTPNGKNKFHEIYQGALDGKNMYHPLRVDWWQVPGRDEEWKRNEIANLGSEALFNQEYGNQFLAGDKLLLSGDAMAMMKRISKTYKWKEIEDLEDENLDYSGLKWHPNFNIDHIDKEKDMFAFSVDIANGTGLDHSVINILKLVPLSKASIKTLRKDRVQNEASMFRLKQVGIFRSNKLGPEDLAKLCSTLLFNVFGADIVKIGLEMNFKGELFHKIIEMHEQYYEDIFLHTKHNSKARYESIGIKIQHDNKIFYCREFRKMVLEKRIVLDEEDTFNEFYSFGLNTRGSYSSQAGHDDIAMTGVNLAPLMKSDMFNEMVEWIYDKLDDDIKNIIQKKLEDCEAADADDDDTVDFLKTIM